MFVAKMKYFALALLLAALLSLSDAYCIGKHMKPGMTHCQDHVDQTWHAVGSSWINSRCLNCTCSQCCSWYNIPTNFPEDCVSVFDSVACEYIVHKKDNPSVQCPIYGGVLK